MRTITQYREEIARLVQKVGDIDAKCIAENRDPSENEIKVKTEIMDALEELRSIVATQERQEKLTSELKAPEQSVTRQRPQKSEDRKHDKFSSFGEQLAAVMKAGQEGNVDPRLRNTRAISGMSETVPSDGGLA